MGAKKSKPKEEELQLAEKYKIPKSTAKAIKEHFSILDKTSDGLLVKEDFNILLNKHNPLSGKTLDAFFFDSDDLDANATSLSSVDLEHFFKVINLFFLFPTKRTWSDFKKIFAKPGKVFEDSKV